MSDDYSWLPWAGIACLIGGTAYALHVMRRTSRDREDFWKGLDDALLGMSGCAIATGWTALLLPTVAEAFIAVFEDRSTSFFWLTLVACVAPPVAALYLGYRVWLRPLRDIIDCEGSKEGATSDR